MQPQADTFSLVLEGTMLLATLPPHQGPHTCLAPFLLHPEKHPSLPNLLGPGAPRFSFTTLSTSMKHLPPREFMHFCCCLTQVFSLGCKCYGDRTHVCPISPGISGLTLVVDTQYQSDGGPGPLGAGRKAGHLLTPAGPLGTRSAALDRPPRGTWGSPSV